MDAGFHSGVLQTVTERTNERTVRERKEAAEALDGQRNLGGVVLCRSMELVLRAAMVLPSGGAVQYDTRVQIKMHKRRVWRWWQGSLVSARKGTGITLMLPSITRGVTEVYV